MECFYFVSSFKNNLEFGRQNKKIVSKYGKTKARTYE
jgi:hypothetical protein